MTVSRKLKRLIARNKMKKYGCKHINKPEKKLFEDKKWRSFFSIYWREFFKRKDITL